jgi:DNA modification methylase
MSYSRIIKTEKFRWRQARWMQNQSLKALSPEAAQKLKTSLTENGFVMAFHVWEEDDGTRWILDGHHRQKVLNELLAEGHDIPEELEGTFIACQDRKEAAKLVLLYTSQYAKLTSEGLHEFLDMHELDFELLQGEIDLPDFSLDDFAQQFAPDPGEAEDDGFEVPEDPEQIETDLKAGDLIIFSKGGQVLHKLLCGDATKPEDLDRLLGDEQADMVLTDPPYNVNYTGGTGLTIENDHMDNDSFFAFLLDFYRAVAAKTKKGGAWYVWHADSEGENFRAAMRKAGLLYKQCLIWVKSSLVLGRQDYQWRHEPCLYGWKEGAAHGWYNDRSQTTVLEFDKPHRNAEHPTMKPIPLFAYQIGNSSRPGEIVCDPFLGSGTTLVASHQTGRRGRGLELSPHYCQVIVNRMTALDPELEVRIESLPVEA